MEKRIMCMLLAVSLCGLAACGSVSQDEGPQPVAPPLMGWSSWNTYRVHISDSLIMRQADALVAQGLRDAGYRQINIDDGFFGSRDAQGVMQPHPGRFPGGMKPVVDHIHALGLDAGIYSDAGSNTCGSIWDDDANGVGAGMYGHEREDAALYFREWGFDFIKIDYCGAGQELNLEERRRYEEIRRAIDAEAGRPVRINICRWAFPGTWARDVASSWRVSPDIAPAWWAVRRCVEMNLYLSAYAGGGHYNDMDMLEIGRGLTGDEEEAHFGMWCIMSSPLLIGCDLTAIPERSLALLKNPELIAINQDPLGLQACVVQHEGAGYVLAKDILTHRGRVRAVALYNPSDEPCDFAVPTGTLELGGRVALRDLTRREDLPPAGDTIRRRLAPHSALILRAEGERRLERTRYEAEWAYLPLFDALGKDARTVRYVPMEGASCGVGVRYLGGSADNCAEWRGVWSERGGDYDLTVRYMPQRHARLAVEAAGRRKEVPLVQPSGEHASGAWAETTVRIRLNPGENTIRMGSPYHWAPDIDRFTLHPVS